MSRFLSAVLFSLLCCAATVQAERIHHIRRSIQLHEQQASEVRERIEQSRAEIEAMQEEERLILDRLDQMEVKLQRLGEELHGLEGKRSALRREVAERRKALVETGGELEKLRSVLGRRLKVLYQFGRHAYLNVLVSARDVGEFQHNWVYLCAIAEQDRRLIDQFRQRQAEEERVARELSLREQRLSKVAATIEQQKAEVEEVKRQQVVLLQDMHNREEMYQRYMEQLTAVSSELESKIARLQREATGAGPLVRRRRGSFAGEKGALPYPVRGEVVSRFGKKRHEEFGTTIHHNGIDIATGELSPVVAVYSGQVLYSGWVRGYGKVIIIDHGDKYYTLTAHLGEIPKEAGDLVDAGEVIGYAGYTPVDGEGSRIYFEIRHHGEALDPQAWLLPVLASADDPGTQ
jgi:septal ring factor EnvC (AmiA/AmiB activator)